ncbi:ABC transporter permease [Ochrobactrum soli]|uniref:ABC transporter permease n=1 Tax=Ochrobactrum soli TaxID=2448455 RepID=A0A849KXT3_9HYPH|nr:MULTISPECIES: ABC transporter permease [Brucella]MCI0999329.1 ABC transporter permease [Ochrobactrum sp. C6C9]WHT45250.1 ABC transporter permease [Ochrobactrum sp. SSR]NNU60862.1 ABC transporter permease [[Ochrobactrum] soli]RLL64009.1 ABC transporter permease [[Ochrobactrum] soli]WHS30408.1 ABC transporter permease [Brucella sp. NM4]
MSSSFSSLGTFLRGKSARQYPPLTSWLLVLPLLFLLVVGFMYPISRLIALSFSDDAISYGRIVERSLYLDVLASTVGVAVAVTAIGCVLGFPVALVMTRAGQVARIIAAICVFIPLWTSVLVRSYAWIVLLQRNGIVNGVLSALGLTEQPLKLLYTQGAVTLAMAHVLMPFVVLPIYAALKAIPKDLDRAALNLGASPWKAFFVVTFPLCLPGIFAGATLCFVLALGFYITPALVGGPDSMLMATLIGQETTVTLDWPFAAALSTVLLGMTIIFVACFRRVLALNKGFASVH